MDNLKKDFAKIYDKYIDKIYRFVFLKVNSQEIAQDLCAETFLKGWEAYKESQAPNPSDLKKEQKIENIQAFLYQIARNLVIDYYREKGKAQIVSADYREIVDPRTNLEEKLMLRSDFKTVRLALNNLKGDYQDVIIWHYLDEFSIAEIAKILNKSEEAVRVMLHRALNSLKNKLTQLTESD